MALDRVAFHSAPIGQAGDGMGRQYVPPTTRFDRHRQYIGYPAAGRIAGTRRLVCMVLTSHLGVRSGFAKKMISGDIAPRRVAKWMRFATQLLPVIPLLFTVIMATLVFAELGKPEWFENVVWLVFSLVMLLVSLLISRRVHAVVSLEFPRRVALLGLCFGCGYNLTAAAGSNCPECGRRNQSVEPPRPKP